MQHIYVRLQANILQHIVLTKGDFPATVVTIWLKWSNDMHFFLGIVVAQEQQLVTAKKRSEVKQEMQSHPGVQMVTVTIISIFIGYEFSFKSFK